MDFLVSTEGAEEGMGTVMSGGSDMAIRGETLGGNGAGVQRTGVQRID